MKVPVSWLKDFVDIDISIEELAKKLVSCGYEIEEIINCRDNIKNVVAGKIKKIENHPNADKLSVCKIDIGSKTIQVITNATNIKENDIVPVALDGGLLPDGTKINTGELRNVISEGMLCGGINFGLIEDDFPGAGIYGILILPEDVVLGTDINDIIGNNEVVLDVSITANRQDSNSILGIAREVAAITNKKIRMPNLSYKETNKNTENYINVENLEYNICPRYLAKVVKNVKIEISPKFIRDRLKSVGIKPINNLVDITNYILTEIGQPMHAFDLNMIEENKIIVRKAKENEKIIALDDKEYKLSANDLAICDGKKPIAIAGVMGGKYSSINEDTKHIVFESASFARDSVRHTSRNLNLHSDSSQRFEKGIDLFSQEIGMERALSLMCEYNWGEITSGIIDKKNIEIKNKILLINYNEINKILGINIDKKIIIDILQLLDFSVEENNDMLTISVPIYRNDIVGVNDIAEEVIRIYGYDHIKPTLIDNAKMVKGRKTIKQKRIDKLKNILIAHNIYEMISYSFISPKAFDSLQIEKESELRKTITIANPIGIDFSVMRTTLAYSMLKTLSNNFLRGNKNVRLFEIAKTYKAKELPLKEYPNEIRTLSIGIYGDNEDFYTMKEIIEDIFSTMNININFEREIIPYMHQGRCAKIISDKGIMLGYLGEINSDINEEFDFEKRIYLAEIDLEYILENAKELKPFVSFSKYQSVERDLAVIMDKENPVQSLIDIIKTENIEILEDFFVFDVYEGNQVPNGKKSVAIKLVFRDPNKTLVDEDVNIIINNIIEKLPKINASLR